MTCAPPWIDIKSLLSHVPLFEGMTHAELAHIASGVREIHATRGEILFRKGETCSGLYLVVYGQVKVFFASQQGQEKILEILDPGQIFGAAPLFHEQNYQLYAQTLSDCFLLHIGKPVIIAELEKSPAFARRIINLLAQRLCEIKEDVESYSLDSGRQRIINYLLREALRAKPKGTVRQSEPTPLAPGGCPKSSAVEKGPNALSFTLLNSKGVIASRLNLTQEHFSRLLHELSGCGLLSVDGRDITIKDLAQLQDYAGAARPFSAGSVCLAKGISKAPPSPRRYDRDTNFARFISDTLLHKHELTQIYQGEI